MGKAFLQARGPPTPGYIHMARWSGILSMGCSASPRESGNSRAPARFALRRKKGRQSERRIHTNKIYESLLRIRQKTLNRKPLAPPTEVGRGGGRGGLSGSVGARPRSLPEGLLDAVAAVRAATLAVVARFRADQGAPAGTVETGLYYFGNRVGNWGVLFPRRVFDL